MTQTFDILLGQREQLYSTRKKEIVTQIHALDDLHKQLSTECIKLRNKLPHEQRELELSQDNMIGEQQKCRQLQWRLDDEHGTWRDEQDAFVRQLQQQQLEMVAQEE